MKICAYIDKNTPELREWLRSVGLTPTDYPDSDEPGLTAPQPDTFGEMVHYNDGLRYYTDDDYNEFEICHDENEFKKLVLKFMEQDKGKHYKDLVGEDVKKTVNRFHQILEYVSLNGMVEDDAPEATEDDPNATPVDGGMGADPNAAPADGGMGGDPNAAPVDDGMGADPNAAPADGGMGGDPNAAPVDDGMVADPNAEGGVEGFAPEGSEEGEIPEPETGAEESEDEEVIDVDELTDSQEKTEKKVNKMNARFEKLFKTIKDFEDNLDANSRSIESLRAELEKRNPTPVEKLSLRSKDGYPFNVSVDDYWKEKGIDSDNYSAEDDNNGVDDQIYQITKNDIDSETNWPEIYKSLNDKDLHMSLKDIMGY